MMYDDLLKKIGEFGWYQKRIFAVTCMQPFTSGLLLLISIFTMATPSYRCSIPGYKNDTYHQQNHYHGYLINQSIPQSSSCLLRNTTVDKYGNMTSLEYKCRSWVYDTSIFTSTFVTEFDMVCDNAVLKSNAVMVLFLGLLFGYGLLGNVADLFGRKPLMVVSNYVFVICAYLMVWSPNYIVLLVLRFFLGLSVSGQALTCYIIGVELVGPSKRRYTGVISNLTWCLGLFMISLFGYLIRNWRYLHLTAAIFSTHLLFFFLIIPESPRWLLTKGYTVKARKIITKVAEVNKKIISETVIGTIKVPANITTAKFWKLCSTKKRCLRTFVIYFMW
ncbi:organic cation transporter protein [Patella vulgata]|uniref:organic cation transporter protein n=1 Tax=Patella vulgata TaxID=6465 RepID=UPI0024A9D166|nr:organic cation transporter protein [Patella vulgata]